MARHQPTAEPNFEHHLHAAAIEGGRAAPIAYEARPSTSPSRRP